MPAAAADRKGMPSEIRAHRAEQLSYSERRPARYSVFRSCCWEWQMLWRLPGPEEKARQTARPRCVYRRCGKVSQAQSLEPGSAACPMNAADSVLPASSFTGVITGTAPIRGGAEAGEVLGTVVAVAKGNRDVEAGLAVPRLPPPHPAKENTIRDKQINERVPETKKECWRRIDYPSATKGQQL